MSAKAIREYDGKLLLAHWLLRSPSLSTEADTTSKFVPPTTKLAHIGVDTSILYDTSVADPQAVFDNALKQQLDNLEKTQPWLLTEKLVAKPDQLIKRRGKSGLLLLNAKWPQVRSWIEERAGKEIKVCLAWWLRDGTMSSRATSLRSRRRASGGQEKELVTTGKRF